MNEITLNIDTKRGFHPVKVVIQENGKTLIDLPGDELVAMLRLWLNERSAMHKLFRDE